MGFSEKSHAFLAAKYYNLLVECFGERGRKAFVHATQYYASQRGRRMAQRAIRDGKELNYETYCQYSEWQTTQEVIDAGCSNQSEVVSVSPDLVMHIHRCPWHQQFREMGALESGIAYCAHLDNSICRGFNPYLIYEVDQTLNGAPYCIHRVKNAGLSQASVLDKNPENIRSFEYHCAHLYWSFRQVAGAIFGGQGEKTAEEVLKDFRKTYGDEMAEILLRYQGTDFNSING